jgi:hypothetical protein
MRRKLLFLATTFSDGNKLFAPVRSYTEVIECPQRNCINSADMFFLMSPTSWNLPLYQRFSGYSCKRNNRLLLESRFNTLFSTNTQNFPFITFPSGKKFCVSKTCSSRKVIVVLLILDHCQRHSLGLGYNCVFRFMLRRFVSGSYWNTHDSSLAATNWESADWSARSGLNLHKLWLKLLMLIRETVWIKLPLQIVVFPKYSPRILWSASRLTFSWFSINI